MKRHPSLALAVACAALFSMPLAACAAPVPAWLAPRPGVIARVEIAPWPAAGEPEAALTQSAASLQVDFSANGVRPGDVVYEPLGVRVRIVRILPHGIALVHGLRSRWEAYAPLDRLEPEVPPGTVLRAAGGFGGYSDFYPALDSRPDAATRLATATSVVAIGMGVARYNPQSHNFVRVFVRVSAGPTAGRTGWIAAAFTGLPLARVPRDASPEERACSCRALAFETVP